MPLENHDKSQPLTPHEVDRLFDRFVVPCLQPMITPRQKESAMGIAKILWLRLITGTDTEEQIYEDLNGMLKNRHDDNIAMGSLYFLKMKTALTAVEIRRLKAYFSNPVNFAHLMDWEPSMKINLPTLLH